MIYSGTLSRFRESRLIRLGVGHIPLRILAITAVSSAVLTLAAQTEGYPLYVVVTFALLPWIPMFVLEALWQYRNFHWLAAFFVIAVLQVGHLGEHSFQVGQMYMNDGVLAHSHGVFGQLDFEAVHFFWDTAVWIGTLVLIWRFGLNNGWLWISLLFASLHQIEHIYLFYVYVSEPYFYHHGGFSGILGKGGILPTVSRPYLHFGYNFMVVMPMVIAYLTQLARSIERFPARTKVRTEAPEAPRPVPVIWGGP